MGPLSGIRVIELAGIGPGPFCGMMLSDMGAEVIRVDRITVDPSKPLDVMQRNRRSVAVDLKNPQGVEVVLRLVESADALFEGYRPGVTERLGLGPDVCLARNPRIVYGRMTGWGQDGPLAQAAGHDINYIALAGALHAVGERGGKPVPPLNLIGDFGGGGMLLALGLVSALLETRTSGRGQIVDAAMIDGTSTLMAMFYAWAHRAPVPQRGTSLLDGGAHFYGTYETQDGEYVAVGALEPKFYRQLIDLIGADPRQLEPQMDREAWPALQVKLAEIFKTRTQAEWCEALEGTDVCFAPVLSLEDTPNHAHSVARNSFINLDGVVQPAPSPRFSRTPSQASHSARAPGADTNEVLADAGFSEEAILELRSAGAVGG